MSDERDIMPHKIVQFGAFTLDVERQRLIGATGPLDLRPKCFDALRYLAEHAGRVVSKDELLDAVWPQVTVGEESLTQCISEIRRAIGDEGRQIIKTIPRRGYLFDTAVIAGHSAEGKGSQCTPAQRACRAGRGPHDVRHSGQAACALGLGVGGCNSSRSNGHLRRWYKPSSYRGLLAWLPQLRETSIYERPSPCGPIRCHYKRK